MTTKNDQIELSMNPTSLIQTLATALNLAYNNGARTWEGLARVAIATIERHNDANKSLS